MDLKHFERKLLEKQGELKATLAALEGEASESGNGDVRDPIDDATVAQGVSEAFEESGIASETLEKVEAALARIRAGSYADRIFRSFSMGQVVDLVLDSPPSDKKASVVVITRHAGS